MTEYRFWIRERGRSRNKWHVSSMNLQPYAFSGIAIKAWDHTPCGKNYHGISTATHETQELPNGTLPTDASGVCRHCQRWIETENRKAEVNG